MRLEVVASFEDLDEDMLLEMANVIGRYVTVDEIDFSFYFGSKDAVNGQHGIRAKICWNKSKIMKSFDGYMELHGDYKYISAKNSNNTPSSYDIYAARYFFKRYKALFSAVWENKLNENFVVSYLTGDISFHKLMTRFEDIDEKYKQIIENCDNARELEKVVRQYNIYNLND